MLSISAVHFWGCICLKKKEEMLSFSLAELLLKEVGGNAAHFGGCTSSHQEVPFFADANFFGHYLH